MTKKIVVGIDGSVGADAALAWALEEARAHGDRIVAVMAWSTPVVAGGIYAPAPPIDLEALEGAAKQTLADALDRANAADGEVKIAEQVVWGSASEALVRASEGARLLVVGSRGLGGFKELLLGSVGHQVAHHARCPVVIVPAPVDSAS